MIQLLSHADGSYQWVDGTFTPADVAAANAAVGNVFTTAIPTIVTGPAFTTAFATWRAAHCQVTAAAV